jgi:hypothetical protein
MDNFTRGSAGEQKLPAQVFDRLAQLVFTCDAAKLRRAAQSGPRRSGRPLRFRLDHEADEMAATAVAPDAAMQPEADNLVHFAREAAPSKSPQERRPENAPPVTGTVIDFEAIRQRLRRGRS